MLVTQMTLVLMIAMFWVATPITEYIDDQVAPITCTVVFLPNLSANGHVQPTIDEMPGSNNSIQLFDKDGIRYVRVIRADTQQIPESVRTFRNHVVSLVFPLNPQDV